ncbi:MAG: Glycosyltransferase [uncultured bacterium]|uniref:D-inositol-3-phosphate glycosyltransferase n=1 Tax=Candidatus Woesebacteria bacterium GW2011_GWA1_40_43 TaxID=1618553 RepID=A0A0G0SDI1_9BACT|nr:MAG: Glycosyltransferase [uncultured bacterium]KKR57692.1 MAG: D-inositol-3-phosphate glycosyltransferase [Candidatus Woesebacteria bacterium GW2011_GWC2_40_30]KKR63008.1 MAG: D-inositol-3-phosphate glycosyltransferase [Candidatus Woesebacteria bacterium GW2011_GWA1_40_43]HAU65704.1 hypothetical protein [Candidatus Woesebacteria bacterium]HCC08730.1 hypothetical protein [Candidatus Woesebacteria bacterium]
MYKSFNSPNTLGIISSYPAHGGEVASGNAISRYTYLLTKNFPKTQKIVVFCEIGKFKKPYLEAPNILVMPTYRLDSPVFFKNILQKTLDFDAISNIMIQFEFSIFGGKIIIPQIMALILSFRIMGKSTKIMFHQVVTNINVLSGHLAIKKNGIKVKILNLLLRVFYKSCGVLADKIFVHDDILAKRISEFVDERKVKIIPHGITMEKKISSNFTKSSRRYFGVKHGTKLVSIFGYCSWYKGTDWLIENFAKFARENPTSNVRLLVAGGESPTLKGTLAYQKYHRKLQKVIKEANGNIICTGFVPENDVRKVFAAADLFVFPYRTKMSASGAFSLCLGYDKPYLVSKAFSENISKNEAEGRTFLLNYKNFRYSLRKNLAFNATMSPQVQGRSWKNAAAMYLAESLPETSINPKLSYAQAF